jgi:lysophospholipase L1-like esterase
MSFQRFAASLLIALPLLAGCRSDESLKEPDVIDPMFRRYVSLGNSITAGFQSAGINDSTQQRSYAALLGAAMQTPFVRPSLQGRGCVPPFTNNVTQARVGGGTAATCDLRATPTARPNNLAVPGARVQELLSNFGTPVSASNALTTFILGGKTQLERMQEAKPTFVTLWIGNNDVLGAFTNSANPGNPALITPEALFIAQYDSVLDAIEATGAKAALVSVANVTNTPFASAGAIYYCLKNGGCPAPLPPQNPALAGIPTFTVNANCAPPGGLQVLVPWTVGLAKVSAAIGGTPSSINCTVDNEVITPTELGGLVTAITAFNTHIQSEATARGWAFVDINAPLAALRADGTIPAFPNVAGALVSPPQPVTFGPIFSLDGVHPSSTAHRLVADSVASAINAHYGTNLPVPVCGTVACPAP